MGVPVEFDRYSRDRAIKIEKVTVDRLLPNED
jgi:hypothetical protein